MGMVSQRLVMGRDNMPLVLVNGTEAALIVKGIGNIPKRSVNKQQEKKMNGEMTRIFYTNKLGEKSPYSSRMPHSKAIREMQIIKGKYSHVSSSAIGDHGQAAFTIEEVQMIKA